MTRLKKIAALLYANLIIVTICVKLFSNKLEFISWLKLIVYLLIPFGIVAGYFVAVVIFSIWYLSKRIDDSDNL